MSEARTRVLWFSNATLTSLDPGDTGTWLQAMAEGLVKSGRVTLGNVTTGAVGRLTRVDTADVQQWIAPAARAIDRTGLPSSRVVSGYVAAVEGFAPDLIHVWGAETFPGLLTARGIVKPPALLEIQGLRGAYDRVNSGGLTFLEQLRCIGLKEVARGSTIFQESASFRRWGVFEQEIMRKHRFMTTPSSWMVAHALAANPSARLFRNEIPLRKPLLSCAAWTFHGAPIIFCSASSPQPLKALHTVIRAAAILRVHFPDLQIRIAGAHQRKGLRLSGYIRWLNAEIRAAGLESNVHWLGPIDATRLCDELNRCSVAVFPSFGESYGVAHAEAMLVGTPAVCAFNGGSSYLAENGKTALLFQAGDHVVCANQIKTLLEDRELASALSNASRTVAVRRHDTDAIIERQLQIYESFLQEWHAAASMTR
jgi:glycosyltransferase involved in cell wall biosynthesis